MLTIVPQSGLHPLFPHPLKICELPRNFSAKELEFINSLEKQEARYVGLNRQSVDMSILSSNELSELHSFCTKEVNVFFQELYNPANPLIETYITESWANFNRSGESHHPHAHANSLISGVLYVNAVKDTDMIVFIKSTHDVIIPDSDFRPIYSTHQIACPVWTGALLLFESSLPHIVPPCPGPHIRVSLSFNTFVKGQISSDPTVQLHLPDPDPNHTYGGKPLRSRHHCG